MPGVDERIKLAYAECRAISQRHYENFPTASHLVPRGKRDALAAIYAFARAADDYADEPGQGSPEDRLRSIGAWRERLIECASQPLAGIEHPVFLALGDSIRKYGLSLENLEHLLRAFEQDAVNGRHQDFNSLLSYCTCSANPVGRLTLELFHYRDPSLFLLSDAICTALQLTNFWQDVAVDLARDRVYLPLDDLATFGLDLATLREFGASKKPVTDARWRRLMAFETARTADLFEQGRLLPERVGRELRRQLRVTWLGGTAILAKIEVAGFDVFHQRPSLRLWDFAWLYLRSWRRPSRQTRAPCADGANGKA